jgi:Dr1-associated corepressor
MSHVSCLVFVYLAKALELFLAMIVDESSKVTIERGSKKVEAYHLYVALVRRSSFVVRR